VTERVVAKNRYSLVMARWSCLQATVPDCRFWNPGVTLHVPGLVKLVIILTMTEVGTLGVSGLTIRSLRTERELRPSSHHAGTTCDQFFLRIERISVDAEVAQLGIGSERGSWASFQRNREGGQVTVAWLHSVMLILSH
jgi:hypothetical protein